MNREIMIRYVAVLGKLSEDGLVFDRYECMGRVLARIEYD